MCSTYRGSRNSPDFNFRMTTSSWKPLSSFSTTQITYLCQNRLAIFSPTLIEHYFAFKALHEVLVLPQRAPFLTTLTFFLHAAIVIVTPTSTANKSCEILTVAVRLSFSARSFTSVKIASPLSKNLLLTVWLNDPVDIWAKVKWKQYQHLSWRILYAICRDDPEKNGGHIKSAQMTHSKCLR